MKRVCIYCGSNSGFKSSFRAAAVEIGQLCARSGLGVVYGGGGVGLMGAVADAALAKGGEVIGIIPKLLVEKEKEHRGVTQLFEVETMHERKKMMFDLSDAFIALPGGIGTLEEIVEAFTWQQLGYHQKPVGILNVDGFFDPLLTFLSDMEKNGFLRKENLDSLLIEEDAETLLEIMSKATPTAYDKWM
jgi:uncharacterized protein (TIGR00730 family)